MSNQKGARKPMSEQMTIPIWYLLKEASTDCGFS